MKPCQISRRHFLAQTAAASTFVSTITASFTYHEPFTLKKEEELRGAYQVYVHAGALEKDAIETAWNTFSRQTHE